MNAQIKKGILEMCILYIIQSSDLIYGYDLIKKMTVYFPEIHESTFYSILRRLHKNNFTDIVLKGISNGPQRKYYTITQEGGDWLNKNIEEWQELIHITKLIGID